MIVLPFANLNDDPEQDYFADGITTDLTTDLGKMPGAFVIGRGTAFTYKNKQAEFKTLGNELGIRWAVQGAVQRRYLTRPLRRQSQSRDRSQATVRLRSRCPPVSTRAPAVPSQRMGTGATAVVTGAKAPPPDAPGSSCSSIPSSAGEIGSDLPGAPNQGGRSKHWVKVKDRKLPAMERLVNELDDPPSCELTSAPEQQGKNSHLDHQTGADDSEREIHLSR